jgi:hypothetical protein
MMTHLASSACDWRVKWDGWMVVRRQCVFISVHKAHGGRPPRAPQGSVSSHIDNKKETAKLFGSTKNTRIAVFTT